MKHDHDQSTAELPGVPPAKMTRTKKYASDAEKQAAYRARNGLVALTVMLPADVHAQFVAKLAAQSKKPSAIVEKLIKSQFLRER